jgi:hypothetical protein
VEDEWKVIELIDPWQNAKILESIKARRFPARMNPQKRRFYNSILACYEFRDNLFYNKVLGKIVPENEKRWAVAERAHRLGHGGFKTTCDNFVGGPYW